VRGVKLFKKYKSLNKHLSNDIFGSFYVGLGKLTAPNHTHPLSQGLPTSQTACLAEKSFYEILINGQLIQLIKYFFPERSKYLGA
jgi:hypothetical protein